MELLLNKFSVLQYQEKVHIILVITKFVPKFPKESAGPVESAFFEPRPPLLLLNPLHLGYNIKTSEKCAGPVGTLFHTSAASSVKRPLLRI